MTGRWSLLRAAADVAESLAVSGGRGGDSNTAAGACIRYVLNVRSPQDTWDKRSAMLQRIQESFEVAAG
jgi:hypothetical protein